MRLPNRPLTYGCRGRQTHFRGKAHPPHDGLHDTWAQVCLNPAHRPRFAEGCARAGWASHCVVGSGCHPIPFRDRSLPLLHNGRQEGERPTRSTDLG